VGILIWEKKLEVFVKKEGLILMEVIRPFIETFVEGE
jgi:hypothetical protein